MILSIESTAHTLGISILDSEKNTIIFDKKNRFYPKEGLKPIDVAQVHSKQLFQYLQEAGLDLKKIKRIIYSRGPGLGPCLRAAILFVRYMKIKYNPLIFGVHHGLAHILSHMHYTSFKNPYVVFVSGGHTVIGFFYKSKFKPFIETTDIAYGNAIDKLGRILGIGGYFGPACEKLAFEGKNLSELYFPNPKNGTTFSFSGCLEYAKKYVKEGKSASQICNSFLKACNMALLDGLDQLRWVIKRNELIVTGGVASNEQLCSLITQYCEKNQIRYVRLTPEQSVDSGLMFAFSSSFLKGKGDNLKEITPLPTWNLFSKDVYKNLKKFF